MDLRTLPALLLVMGLAPLAAQAPPAKQPPAKPRHNGFLVSRAVPDLAAVKRGEKVFVANCAFCHGTKATGGDTGPDLVRSPLALDDDGGDKIGPVIKGGRPGKGMPAIPLTDAQIKDVAAFLRDRQQAAIDRNAYAILNVVTGDAKRGEAFFNGDGRCNTCHSPTGDLAHITKKFDPVGLQSQMLYPQAWPGGPPPESLQSSVTVTLRDGTSFSGRLEYIDDFDVALRDASGEYHSFSRGDDVKVEVHDPRAAHEELVKRMTDAEMHNVLAYLETLK
ncbi:MAG TPA: c-type cytochrome [Bryobacteraceae bacterium]|nr:c-type cytochrome [Bryobacteraceae bacterium]